MFVFFTNCDLLLLLQGWGVLFGAARVRSGQHCEVRRARRLGAWAMTSVVLVDSGGSVVEYVTVVDDSQQVSKGVLNLGQVTSPRTIHKMLKLNWNFCWKVFHKSSIGFWKQGASIVKLLLVPDHISDCDWSLGFWWLANGFDGLECILSLFTMRQTYY